MTQETKVTQADRKAAADYMQQESGDHTLAQAFVHHRLASQQSVPNSVVEAMARASCEWQGYDPDEIMPDSEPRWKDRAECMAHVYATTLQQSGQTEAQKQGGECAPAERSADASDATATPPTKGQTEAELLREAAHDLIEYAKKGEGVTAEHLNALYDALNATQGEDASSAASRIASPQSIGSGRVTISSSLNLQKAEVGGCLKKRDGCVLNTKRNNPMTNNTDIVEALALFDDALDIMFDGPDDSDAEMAYKKWQKGRATLASLQTDAPEAQAEGLVGEAEVSRLADEMQDNPFWGDEHLNGTTDHRDRLEHYATIALTALSRNHDEARRDSKRLDWLVSESADVRWHSDGDDGILLEIVGHWMAKPHERLLAINSVEDLRGAIDEAMKGETLDQPPLAALKGDSN